MPGEDGQDKGVEEGRLAYDKELNCAAGETDVTNQKLYSKHARCRFVSPADRMRIHLSVNFCTEIQAALAHIRAQEPAQPCDWSAVSTHGYMDVVNRLLPQMDVDMDTLEDEEQLEIVCARAQRRTLGDIFVDKHRVVSSLKMRALLTVSGRPDRTLLTLYLSRYPVGRLACKIRCT